MIGIDLVKIERIKGSLEKFEDKFLLRYLSKEEMALVKSPRTAAGFWAAKEACSKALGCGIGKECGFHDILLSKSPKGAPLISLSPALLKTYCITDMSLSISHDGDYAVAVVAIESATTHKV